MAPATSSEHAVLAMKHLSKLTQEELQLVLAFTVEVGLDHPVWSVAESNPKLMQQISQSSTVSETLSKLQDVTMADVQVDEPTNAGLGTFDQESDEEDALAQLMEGIEFSIFSFSKLLI